MDLLVVKSWMLPETASLSGLPGTRTDLVLNRLQLACYRIPDWTRQAEGE